VKIYTVIVETKNAYTYVVPFLDVTKAIAHARAVMHKHSNGKIIVRDVDSFLYYAVDSYYEMIEVSVTEHDTDKPPEV